ncbi:hypothetical protein BK133_30405 [Paenibacillus sp. FSL H8-0548]|uniref:hypothetical protein n=1 Tax=Paenibacillus sp. FSL H8-0548 TaxID=1920422 RepID=UPI00096FDDF6|nr:hypothetical protein [Paenibacillus sp. FSL H8-0548]OMF18532.1 hypothetical protein BK133_30405 [Paenibacillus sp. FSL H8-0548]
MNFITKEQLNNNLGNKSKIELVDLIKVIEEQFGYKVSISRKFTEEQKKKMTKAIFSNEDVLRQLDESELEPEENDIESFEDYSRFIKGVGNEQ